MTEYQCFDAIFNSGNYIPIHSKSNLGGLEFTMHLILW